MRLSRPSVNPVLRRELVERWRAQRAVWALTGYLTTLGLLLYLLYRAGYSLLNNQIRFGFGELDPAVAGPMLGRFLVEGLLFFVLVLVLFVAPGYAAAQLSGERERRTLPLLQVTMLRPGQIVLGKLGASVAWVSLLVVASVPLGAAAFFLGGVAIEQLLRGIGFVLAIGVCVAAMALGISSVTRRTTGAVVITYALVLGLTGGTLFLSAVEFLVRANTGAGRPQTPVALYANPFVGLADAIHTGAPPGALFGPLPSPLSMIAGGLQQSMMLEEEAMLRGGVMMGEARAVAVDEPATEILVDEVTDGVVVPEPLPPEPVGEPMLIEPPPPMRVPPAPEFVGVDPFVEPRRANVWARVLGLYAALGLAGLVLATLRVRTTEVTARMRGRSARKESAA